MHPRTSILIPGISNNRFRKSPAPTSQGPYQPPSSSSAANSATHTPTNSEIQPTPANTPVTQRPTSSQPSTPSLSNASNSLESNNTMASADDILASYHLPSPKPLWLNVSYAKHIVKGNFMTLSARPKTVEPGEWVAHQGKSLRNTFLVNIC